MYELSSGIEICLAILSCENPVEWINIESGEIMDARAFDWTELKPIPVGRERTCENKEFVYRYCAEANLTGFLKKSDWKAVALYVEHKTSVWLLPSDLENKIKELVESGAKRIVIVSKAMTLGRKSVPDNTLIYRVNVFNSDNIDYQVGWNQRITAKGGKYLIKTKGLYAVKVVNK